MVPVQGTVELATTTRFALAPSEPLRPGSSYTLRLEGATRREAHDSDGRAYLPAALRLGETNPILRPITSNTSTLCGPGPHHEWKRARTGAASARPRKDVREVHRGLGGEPEACPSIACEGGSLQLQAGSGAA